MKKTTKHRTPKVLLELAMFLLCVIGGCVAYAQKTADVARDPKIQWYLAAAMLVVFAVNAVRLSIFRRPVSAHFTVWSLLCSIVLLDVFIFYSTETLAVFAVAAIFAFWTLTLLTGKIVAPAPKKEVVKKVVIPEQVEQRKHDDAAWQAEEKAFLSNTYIKNSDDPYGVEVVAGFAERHSHKLYYFNGAGKVYNPGDMASYVDAAGNYHTVIVAIPSLRRDITALSHTLPELIPYTVE